MERELCQKKRRIRAQARRVLYVGGRAKQICGDQRGTIARTVLGWEDGGLLNVAPFLPGTE